MNIDRNHHAIEGVKNLAIFSNGVLQLTVESF